MSKRRSLLCPVRPSAIPGGGLPSEDEEEWEDPNESPVLAVPLVAPRHEIDEDMVDGDDGSVVQAARALPEPKKPTREEVARHNINHLPYRNWCPHCVSCRRSNAAHPSKSSAERTLPLFVSDYCFVRKADESLVTILVGKLYPSRSVFASVCDTKGPDDSVTDRLASFFREAGHSHIIYKNDQEPALCATVAEAIRRSNRSGDGKPTAEVIQMVPEWSAVGESPSNGKAERTVQLVEDLLRTYLHALEGRLQTPVPSESPIVRWWVAHVMNMLNMYTVNPDGVTPYAALHGKRAVARHAEFGDRVFWHVPKRARSK